MQINNTNKRSLADWTKDTCRKLRHRHNVNQQDLEFALDTDQSNISRWENPDLDQYPPVYLIAACLASRSEKLERFALDYLDQLEAMAGRMAQPLTVKANGSLEDEFADAAINEGEFAKALKTGNLEKAEQIAHQFQSIGQRMLAEIKAVREKERNAK